jgi:hypothetical protein
MSKHTPGPWRAFANGGDDTDPRKLIICAKGGFDNDWHMIAQADYGFPNDGDPEANAAFIVRACNAHDDMLAALKAFHAFATEAPGLGLQWRSIVKKAEAAIAKAEAQP